MSQTTEPQVQWSQEKMIEVRLNEPDDFLKVRETLTRIGVALVRRRNCISLVTSCINRVSTTSYTSRNCLLLMVSINLTINDVQRRNRITKLLSDWGLINVCVEDSIIDIAPLNQIKVLPYKEKSDWVLEQKYNIGNARKQQQTENQS